MEGRLSERVSRGRSTATSHRSTMHLLRLNRSVVGGILNASWWPTILRTDTAATTRVDKRVVLISIYAGATCNNSNFMKLLGASRNETAIGTTYPMVARYSSRNGVNIAQFQTADNGLLIPGIDLDYDSSSLNEFYDDDELCDPGRFFWFEGKPSLI